MPGKLQNEPLRKAGGRRGHTRFRDFHATSLRDPVIEFPFAVAVQQLVIPPPDSISQILPHSGQPYDVVGQ